MRIPSTPRRTGARNKPVHFSYVGTEKGPPYEAYIAGPTWWGYLHMLRPSKPCVYELTKGAVACRFCGGPRIAVVKGWVPIYRRSDSWPICVPVDEVQRDHIDNLATFTKVLVGRDRGKGAGVFVRAATNDEPKWTSTLPECQVEADITESLIRMWKLPEVFSYFGCGESSDNALSQTGAAVVGNRGQEQADKKATDAPQNPALDRMIVGSAVDDQVARLNRHVLRESANGNGNGKH